ncbi:MAG: AAA family ATPase [Rubrivivax sp.]|nr:AAA family ATPase [Rubrivivax sp.]
MQRWPTRAVAALLARLALEPQRAHAREELVELLWPGSAPDAGRNRLRQALSTLRGLLGGDGTEPVLEADRLTVRVRPGTLACDVPEFEALSRAGDPAAAALYRGEFMPGHYDDWVVERRGQLQDLRAAIDPDAPARRPTPGRPPPGQAIGLPGYLTRAYGLDDVAAQLRSVVLERRLVTVRGPGGSGKTRLASEVARTLVAAADVAWADGFERVVFVPLVHCTSADGMVDALMLALQAAGGGPSVPGLEGVAASLRGRRTLLVLDNCEQLDTTATAALADWLARLPELHLLVTSRRALQIDGEHEVVVAGLPLPEPCSAGPQLVSNPALALLVERARAVRPGYAPDADEAEALASLARRLEGLPLALELAAARLRALSAGELLARLGGEAETMAVRGERSHADDDGLDVLERRGQARNAGERQSSMRSVVLWSHALLSASERRTLLALSVFRGGATADRLADVVAVPGTSPARPVPEALLDDLDALVAHSVVRTIGSRQGGTRYQPFEPVREVVLSLTDGATLRQLAAAHRHAMRRLVATLGPSPDLRRFRIEVPNIVAALASAIADGTPDDALALIVDAAQALHEVVLPPQALEGVAAAVRQRAGTPAAVTAQALLAEQLFESGRGEAALAEAEAALRAAIGPPAMPPPTRALALRVAARLRVRVRADIEGARPLAEEAAALGRALGLADIEATATSLMSVIEMNGARDLERNERLHRHALQVWRAGGLEHRAIVGMVNLSLALGFRRRVEEQLELLAQAIPLAETRGLRRIALFGSSIQGYALADRRRWVESAESSRRCIREAWAINAWREWFYGLWNLPRTLAMLGRAEDAVRLLSFADRYYREHFGSLGRSDLRERRRTRRLARLALGAARTEALWIAGGSLTPAQATQLACDQG